MHRLLTAVLWSLTLVPATHAQSFSLADLPWTLVSSGSGGGTVSADLMHVEGSSSGFCTNELVYFETTAPITGTVRVHLDWVILDVCHYDWPIYVIDGVFTKVPVSGDLSCFGNGNYDLTFDVQAGQSFGLGVGSSDCYDGPGIADWTNFSLLSPSWTDLGFGLDPRVVATISPGTPSGGFGESMLAFGDVTGDGVSDVAVGDPWTRGVVSAHSGADGSLLWTTAGTGVFGLSLTAPGDVDGDGLPDLLVGAYADSTVRMVSGLDGSTLWSWTWGGLEIDYYGSAVAAYGDVDGDGVRDVAVGSSKSASLPVRVLSGADGGEFATLAPGPLDVGFGGSMGSPGDVDGDGVGDLALVTRGGTARVVVISGASSSELLAFTPTWLAQASATPSGGVTGVSDQDGDGLRDLLVGVPYGTLDNGASGYPGVVSIHSGVTGAPLAVFEGPDEFSQFGAAMGEVADVDGDGAPELVVGAPRFAPAFGDRNGRVDVLRASDGHELQHFEGRPGDELGRSLASIAGASEPTLMIGAPDQGILGQGAGGHVLLVHDLDHIAGAPRLGGVGELVPGTAWIFRVSHGLPGNLAAWILGLSAVELPFKGGVLVPSPDVVLLTTLDGAGSLLAQGTWPTGAPLPEPLWLQVWMPDPSALKGYSATPALLRDEP